MQQTLSAASLSRMFCTHCTINRRNTQRAPVATEPTQLRYISTVLSLTHRRLAKAALGAYESVIHAAGFRTDELFESLAVTVDGK